MPVILKHPEIAVELARHSMELYSNSIEQMDLNWRVAVASNDSMPALAGRMGLFEYLSAASVVGDHHVYEAARTAVLSFGGELATHFRPQPEILLTEMALAIVSADRPARRTLAKAISGVELQDDTLYLERSQALTLAALVDLDYDATQRLASQLLEACEALEFDKKTTELAEHWAHAASKLAGRDLEGSLADLQLFHEAHLNHVDRELSRLKRGASSDLSSSDLLDLSSAALARLLGEFGLKPLLQSEEAIIENYGLWKPVDRQAVEI